MFFFPLQAFGRLVAFVRTRSGVPLRLDQFGNMDNHGHVFFAGDFFGLFVGFDQGGIVPAAHAENFESVAFFVPLKAFQYLGNVLLGGLVFGVHRNAVFVVPNADDHGYLKHACRIHRFPKKPFGRAGIAYGAPGNFVAVARKFGGIFL